MFASTAPIAFDKRTGYFWKGRVTPADRFRQRDGERKTRLDRIHALQIISELCRSRNSSYYSHELNLVLVDGKRINVVDHGNLPKLQEDAEILARFLGTPIWDATR